MAFIAHERTNANYTVTIKDQAGAVIPKANISSFKLTLLNLDDDAQTIINSRNAQEQATGFTGDLTVGVSDGLVTFKMQPADNQLILLTPGQNQRYERHRLIFDITLTNGTRLVWQDEIVVENKDKVTT